MTVCHVAALYVLDFLERTQWTGESLNTNLHYHLIAPEGNGIKLALTIDLTIGYEVPVVVFSLANIVWDAVCARAVHSAWDGVD